MKIDDLLIEMPELNHYLEHMFSSLREPTQRKKYFANIIKNSKKHSAMKDVYVGKINNADYVCGYENGDVTFFIMWDVISSKFPILKMAWRNKSVQGSQNHIKKNCKSMFDKHHGIIFDETITPAGKSFTESTIHMLTNTVYVLKNYKTIHEKSSDILATIDEYTGETSEYSQYTFLITTDKYDIGDYI